MGEGEGGRREGGGGKGKGECDFGIDSGEQERRGSSLGSGKIRSSSYFEENKGVSVLLIIAIVLITIISTSYSL